MEIYITGEDSTALLSNIGDHIMTNNHHIERTNTTSLLASFSNGVGVIINSATLLAFTLVVPSDFQGETRGECVAYGVQILIEAEKLLVVVKPTINFIVNFDF